MTRITAFSIEGLSGRRAPVEHELNSDVNVFWGPNGSGKTSMLKILHAALNNTFNGLESVSFEKATVEFRDEENGKTYSRTIDRGDFEGPSPQYRPAYDPNQDDYVLVRDVDEAPKWRSRPRITVRRGGQFPHSWLPITRIFDAALNARRSQRAYKGMTDFEVSAAFAEAIEERWRNWRYQANNEINAVQDLGLTEVLEVAIRGARKRDQSVELLDTEQAYDLVTKFVSGRRSGGKAKLFQSFEDFAKRYSEDTILPDIVQRLQQVEARIAEITAPQHRLEKIVRDLFSKGREIEFSARGISVTVGDRQIPLGFLSSGESQLMLILLECLRAGPHTMLIDEPELSMHVVWQNKLIESMHTVNPETQLIMATHSPEIMAELEDRCIIEL